MTLKEKTNQLLELREKINAMAEAIKPFQIERDELQADIMKNMIKQGFSSIKTDIATISKSSRKTLAIIDEDVLVQDLKKRGLTDLVKERINSSLFRGFATEAVKQNLTPDGTEIKTTEFISIRKVKDKNDGKTK